MEGETGAPQTREVSTPAHQRHVRMRTEKSQSNTDESFEHAKEFYDDFPSDVYD